MKSSRLQQTKTQECKSNTQQECRSGQSAVSVAPPAYGLDFVDQVQTQEPSTLPIQRFATSGPGPASTSTSVNTKTKTGLPASLKSGIEGLSGFSMDDVKVHYNSQKPSQLKALAFAQGRDIHLASGQERHLPHEAWHVVQQKQGRVKPTLQMKANINVNDEVHLEREADVMGNKALLLNVSNASDPQKPLIEKTSMSCPDQAPLQARFGFEIELPMLFTHKGDKAVPSLAGGLPIPMTDVPMDAGFGGTHTNLVNGDHCYLNVDHSRTLNKLYDAELDQYAADNALNQNAQDSLKAISGTLMPSGASIVEVVTTAWDENTLSRTQARARVQNVVAQVDGMYDDIAGDTQVPIRNYYLGSDSANSSLFQPRLGYFHATYGIKLAQIPHLFEQTTKNRRSMARYARNNAPEQAHATNVALTRSSVAVAKTALAAIKGLWPTVTVTRKILPDKQKVDLSSTEEKDFLGFLTLICNYFMLMDSHNGGDDLAKKLVGMHYYKSDLYDVASQLPAKVIDPLQAIDHTLADDVINAICTAVGINNTDTLNRGLSGYTVKEYLWQIFRGYYGVIQEEDENNVYNDQHDASGATFMDPVLAGSINPYSSKLDPEQLGPLGRQGLGVVMENRHLEYLDSDYGSRVTASQRAMARDVVQYGPPKAGLDTRTALEKAMYDSIGAREEGPAKRPIGEWEGMMMNIYDMVKAINGRR
ncbi:MAG: DUF4157 domain-containing protein [Nitrospirota bacterium]|nr:DUF4157 domain-containing protein [Nitrospirota bacterium]